MIKLGDNQPSRYYIGNNQVQKMYLGEELVYEAPLPEGYTRLQYIGYGSRVTKGPKIPSGVHTEKRIGLKCTFRHKFATSNSTTYILLGTRGGSSSNYNYFAFGRTGSTNKFYYNWGHHTSLPAAEERPDMPNDVWTNVEINYLNSGKWRFSNELGTVAEGDVPDDEITKITPYQMALFGYINYSIPMDIQETILTQGEEIVAHGIPCRRDSDGLAGMYDIVQDVFRGPYYYSENQRVFTEGADYVYP